MLRHRPFARGAKHRLSRALLFALLLAPAAAGAQGLTGPATAVFITYDNSLSMDYTTTLGEIPAAVSVCDPSSFEYARTRHVIATEAFTGSFQDYCYAQLSRDQTFGTRDDVASYPVHTLATFSRQRRDGLLDVYADTVYFGLGTFDSLASTSEGALGDYSFGPNRGSSGTLNVGLADYSAPVGGLVSPLPPGWVPETPGALRSFQLWNNRHIQSSIMSVVPGLGTPLSAAIDDLRYLRHRDPGIRSDPFRACRPFAHVLVTDGASLWDQCVTSGTGGDGLEDFPCAEYLASYPPPAYEAYNLAQGSLCADCPSDAGFMPVPTYVVAFANDDPSVADQIAELGGTCAVLDPNGACIRHAFRAEAQAELIFSLGTVFNRFLDGRISAVPPLSSTVALEQGLGLARFHAGAVVSHESPYWTGTLSREVFSCQPVPDTEESELVVGEPIFFEDQFDSAFVSERAIYTARLDVASRGSSCERPSCPIDSPSCFDTHAVPNPLVDGSLAGYGDGTGGLDKGGTDSTVADDLESEAECTSAEYAVCVFHCPTGDDTCQCRCQEWFQCGTCGFIGVPEECPTELLADCVGSCELQGGTEADCTCACEDRLDCGTCAEGPAFATEDDAYDREAIDAALLEQRLGAGIRGNDDPLPAPPPSVDFDAVALGDSCLIPFDIPTFVETQDLSGFLYAESSVEAKRTIDFVRGETLSALADRGLLSDIFDPATVALHDRPATGYVGDFFHSHMALLSPPTLMERNTPGFQTFVEAVGNQATEPRPHTLFIGSNDGMLHAFDALIGTELWAIIPPSFLPQLGQTVVSHRIAVDGPVVARNLICSSDTTEETWCSLLAVSYRGGGSGAMVLDVTDPTAPRFLFEVTGRQIPELGLGYPRPLLGNMFIGNAIRPVLVLAGGRPLEGRQVVIGETLFGSHEGEVLVVMDALTGEIYRQFDPVSHGDLFARCGPVTGSPSAWSDDLFTRLFVGTQNGCLLRFDTSDADPLQWTAERLYQTHSPGEITFEPALAPRSDGTLVIVFGHGDTDQLEQVNQMSNLVSVSESRGFVPGDEETGQLGTFTLGSASANWELQLEPGEVITTAPIVADGVVFVASWVPNAADPCSGGSPRLYGIDFIGDPAVSGSDSTLPHLVDIDSDRIIARLESPDFDPENAESQQSLKFFDSDVLGAEMVVYGVEIDSIPDCSSITALPAGAGPETMMATTRQLMVEGVVRDTAGEEPGEPDGGDGGEDDGAHGIVSLAFELPRSNAMGITLDWGVVVEH